MAEPNPELTKPTRHPGRVKTYITEKGIDEQTARDLVARDLMIERQKDRSLTDPLTGLYNRRWLFGEQGQNANSGAELRRLFERTRRDLEALTYIAIDVDHFKNINDKFGHSEGDRVLKNLARIFRENLRFTDEVIRINGEAIRTGGEEFVIILQNTRLVTRDQLSDVLNRLNNVLAKSKDFPESKPPTISIGIATYDSTDINGAIQNSEQLVDYADKALYHAKETGRNKAVIFTGAPDGQPQFEDLK